MRIHIAKPVAGEHQIMVVPGRRKHLAPVIYKGSDRAAVIEQVGALVRELQGEQAKPA